MKNIILRICLVLCTATLSQGIQANSDSSILESESHPESPTYESVFPDKIVPLDAKLSWKRRFLGNETFNTDEALPPTSPELDALFRSSTNDTYSTEIDSTQLDATGIVKQVKAAEGKIKIEHGPIERLGMPAMTMMFRIEDTSQLAGLEKGAEIAFNVDNTAAGFSITKMSRVGEDAVDPFDASGMIKSIRSSQGKIKIEHGPIDRLGMPAMTMMFIVKDMAALESLDKNMEVQFDVVNGPGGFEITRIQPVSALNSGSTMANAGSLSCYKIGPFSQRSNVEAVSKRYRGSGVTTKLSATTDREYVGDMIYIESQETRQAALDIARDLERKGISDYMVLNEPGKENALSLGVYGLKQNASRIKSRVEALNYTVKSEARFLKRTLYWLHNEQLSSTGALDLLTAEEIESGIRQSPSDCDVGEDA